MLITNDLENYADRLDILVSLQEGHLFLEC